MRFKVRKRCEVHDCFFFLFFFLGIKGSILRSGEFDSFFFFSSYVEHEFEIDENNCQISSF